MTDPVRCSRGDAAATGAGPLGQDPAAGRYRFTGHIAGVGSASGVRVVVGVWDDSPFGAFADAMVEDSNGHRILVAPSAAIAQFVAQTYTFDETRVEAFRADRTPQTLHVKSPSLSLVVEVGRRTPLGWLLRGIPGALGRHPAFATAVDPIARVALRGVRTRGTARAGRREWYAAGDHRRVTGLRGRWDGHDLGELAPVDPPTRFGFSSTPRTPALTAVTTTVQIERRADPLACAP